MFDTNEEARAHALIGMTRDIVVAAAASRNISDLATAIGEVHAALSLLGGPVAPVIPLRGEPAVTARKSVTPEAVTCMSCGAVFKSLKRHLRNHHGMTPEAYREHWNLAADHPIIAPNYSAVRSRLAKDNGLGKKL